MAKKGPDSFTKVLLHLDGANASTVITDEILGKTWTANGGAKISTAQSKFGGASVLFNGSTDWIDTPDHADFALGSGNFTFDFWIRRAAINSLQNIFGQNDSSLSTAALSIMCWVGSNNKVVIDFYGTSNKELTSVGLISDTNWHHTAIVRNGNTLFLYLDGIQDSSIDVTGLTANDSSNKFAVGRAGEYTSTPFNGYIDEFRFSKGVARWTTNFTPPTAPY